MSNRRQVPPIPADPLEAIKVLAELLEDANKRIDALEARSGQSLPADYRFDVVGTSVHIRRVRTGNTVDVTGAL